ncbi:GNAT family N-acetyltransferase [Mongoliimonas terrestris]|uniref:GNAT family N-acetyltransferase n=1 Tax=Mongoliimonas terrestris TaxID=1709001 RepID=UPI0009F8D251|nr:GNAT family N-acetyltransferase [Mongoliimonas terrestris]
MTPTPPDSPAAADTAAAPADRSPAAVTIRHATPSDLAGIMAIYNDAVLNTTAIWNETVVDLDDRRRWYDARIAGGYPVLVATDGESVVGYASYGPFRAFEGFRHTAELSIYVAAGQRGRRIGDRLLGALVTEAQERGVHVLVAGIEAENLLSLKLHVRHAFYECARMKEVGNKFNRWLDLVFMQRLL